VWLYIPRESTVQEDGERLGPFGGRIVGEVMIGVIAADPESYLRLEPSWRPTLPAHGPQFGLRDILVPA
jgi:hypothetical protein